MTVWGHRFGKSTWQAVIERITRPSPQELTRDFHDTIGAATPPAPRWPPAERRELRETLFAEEATELEWAAEGGLLRDLVKELCDVLAVTYGWALEAGVDLDACYRIVHADNMRKAQAGTFRADGKLMKPEGYDRERVRRELYAELKRQGLDITKEDDE